MSTTKFPISSLPLPPPSHILTHNLTPDPRTHPLPSVLTSNPSVLRRARLLDASSHFAYVSPLPIPFPFDIRPPSPPAPEVEDKAKYIEEWLTAREALHPRDSDADSDSNTSLKVYYPKNRDQPRELIGLAETGLRDCLPHLDVGDAFDTIGAPAFVSSATKTDSAPSPDGAAAVRQELIDVLSGHAMLMSLSDKENGDAAFTPWSLRYSGHQFGVWAGQLGDGRAMTVHITPHPTNPDLVYELQLKGAGRTPFSRSADGLAVLRSSIREFLGAEAMNALRIPTTRSLSLISLPALPVARERMESACILTRLAPSFLRIGSFEAFNAPANTFFLGGGQQERDFEGLRVLGEWVSKRVLRLGGAAEGGKWGKKLVLEVARRNAEMVAGWQAYGFMHGVINTDNVSVLGLTIDYGPYAFMDVFDPWHICNHTDGEGRYAYKYQPNMIIYAVRALLNALAPLIGAELSSSSSSALTAGWAADADDKQIAEWRDKALAAVKDEMEEVVQDVCSREYGRLMRKRLGLRRQDPSDESQITRPLLDIMQEHKLDFHGTFRALCFFRTSLVSAQNGDVTIDAKEETPLDKFISRLVSQSPELDTMDRVKATEDWRGWLARYTARIHSERDEWSADEDVEAAREEDMKNVNPRFVLRQWVLEEVIEMVERDPATGKRVLGKVLKMACSPFEGWGEEGKEGEGLNEEVREERRFCGMGERKMLGFQCSCSS